MNILSKICVIFFPLFSVQAGNFFSTLNIRSSTNVKFLFAMWSFVRNYI